MRSSCAARGVTLPLSHLLTERMEASSRFAMPCWEIPNFSRLAASTLALNWKSAPSVHRGLRVLNRRLARLNLAGHGLVQSFDLRHQILHLPLERRDLGALRRDGLAQAAKLALDLLARHAQDFGPVRRRKLSSFQPGRYMKATKRSGPLCKKAPGASPVSEGTNCDDIRPCSKVSHAGPIEA